MAIGEIATWAEVISALAIVLSLLFVGFEVAQNNKLSKNNQHQTNLVHLNSYKKALLDRGLSDVVFRGRLSFQGLSEEEKLIFCAYMETALPNIISIRVFAEQSAYGAENARDFTKRAMRSEIDHPGVREWWVACRETVSLGPPGRKAIDRQIGADGIKAYSDF
jgi:hypothetical protein